MTAFSQPRSRRPRSSGEPRRAGRSKNPGIGRTIIVVLAALGLLQLLVSATPLTEWWTLALAGSWSAPAGNTLVVFGNDIQPDGTIGEVSYWRTFYAVLAWREGKFQHLILCGGPAANPISEAMRRFAVSQGVDAGRVLTDRTSGSTRENAIEAKQLVDTLERPRDNDAGVVLLTSDYHTFRAIRAARKVGLAARPHPVPDLVKRTSVWYQRWDAFLTLSAETAKIAYYWARGWI